MENEFIEWFKANELRFAHSQLDAQQIAYSAWLEAKRWIIIGEEKPKGKVLLKGINEYEKERHVLGFWVPQFSYGIDGEEVWEYADFDQRGEDAFYLKEGWYEECYSASEIHPIDLVLTHYRLIQ